MKTLGQVAFEAYNASKGGKTWDGKPIPPWETLTDETGLSVRQAWEASAIAVIAEFTPFDSMELAELLVHRDDIREEIATAIDPKHSRSCRLLCSMLDTEIERRGKATT